MRYYGYTGSAYGTSIDSVMQSVEEQVDKFRGDWEVINLTVCFSNDEDVPGVYIAEFDAALQPKAV